MEIKPFLCDHFIPRQGFHAAIISVDVVKSRELRGSDKERLNTKRAIRDLIRSMIGDLPMAILDWRGDGGLLICDVSNGYDYVVQFCDHLVGMIPVINRSRGIYNFLKSDMIRLRIVCNAGFFENPGDPEVLSKNVIDDLFGEKDVGVIDHVVITHSIFDKLSPPLCERFLTLPKSNTPLDPCYVLDGNYAQAEIELNTGTSEGLRKWIAEEAVSEKYTELLIFSYTNESLYHYFTARLPNLKIKVLMRNWLVEEQEEYAFNLARQKKKRKAPSGLLKKNWEKANTMRAVARQLMDRDKRPGAPEVDIRFYSDKPFLKGAILRGPDGQVANVGLYSWNPDREEGGSPYLGENWPSIWASGDEQAKTRLLDTLVSRFDELWVNGLTYEEMLKREIEWDQTHERNVEKIFCMDGRPYLIIIPGEDLPRRILPKVESEDMSAAHLIRDMLVGHGAEVFIEVIAGKKYSPKIHTWDGHIISMCHRTWVGSGLPGVSLEKAPYRILTEDEKPARLYLADLRVEVSSPMDGKSPKKSDHCLIIKTTRENGAKFLFVAGIHAIGTWGGGRFLTERATLATLTNYVQRKDFAVVVECKFTVDRQITSRIIHGPSIIDEVT